VCLQCFDAVGWASGRHLACKNWVLRCWRGYLSEARCRLFAYGPADATDIPKPDHLLPHLNPDWFYWLIQVVLEKRPLKRCSSCSSSSRMLHRKKTPNSGNSLACLESMTQPDWKPIQLTAGTNNQCALSTDTNTNSFSPTSTHSYIYLARHDFLLVFHSNLWSSGTVIAES